MCKHGVKSFILSTLGLLLSVLPVSFAILLYFPLWRRAGGGAVLSGAVLILLIVAFVPLMRVIKAYFKSPSAYAIWFCSFLLFFTLSSIAEEMTVISFVGFVSNLLGAYCFKFAKRLKGSEEKSDEE